ncbi:nitrous oxide reductase accessory protein NosL [Candidatus Thiosymbion oneisti]|uniref:nitrous oxide reductase accessory protein NosL n=1 Tax=Candidatus Thiosymbion oneisti TaxID=589554 RepID=UPI0013FDA34B|nr:hypothetical protein [Candidatus Thiosymbion oneisti]
MRDPQFAARGSPARTLTATLALSCLAMLAGCGGEPATGPVAVKWDRVACERCRMVLSDRHHGAQVRVKDLNGKSEVFFFDDIGCAVIWLDDKPWRDDPQVEIWVSDWRSGEWIDARAASYLSGQETPMQYSLGAQSEPAEAALDYAAAKAHIFAVERRFNRHGGSLDTGADLHRRK